MYRKILVPLDGSGFAESALPQALTLSRRAGAALHVTTVWEPRSSFGSELHEGLASEWAAAYLAEVAARVEPHAGGAVTTGVRTGGVVDQLRGEAGQVEADLVVMATHGRGAVSRAWLGSVADAFVRRGERPVLLVRPHEEEAGDPVDSEAEVHRVLVPLDGSEPAEAALRHAESVGALFGAEYVLVRAVAPPLSKSRPYLADSLPADDAEVVRARTEEAEQYVAEVARDMNERGRDVETRVTVSAQPARAILAEADQVGCDLIVMATHGRSGLPRALLGSTTDKVVRGASIPVLVHRREA